jgi:hypothetical protein
MAGQLYLADASWQKTAQSTDDTFVISRVKEVCL